jgi:hypothetical protein
VDEPSRVLGLVRGVGGAVLGAVLGYWVFVWLLWHGFYALILPGTLLGLGFGLFSRRQSTWWGIGCGVLGVAMGVFSEWRTAPFVEDGGLLFFLSHLYQLRPPAIVLILLGGLFAFWFGVGRDGGDSSR